MLSGGLKGKKCYLVDTLCQKYYSFHLNSLDLKHCPANITLFVNGSLVCSSELNSSLQGFDFANVSSSPGEIRLLVPLGHSRSLKPQVKTH